MGKHRKSHKTPFPLDGIFPTPFERTMYRLQNAIYNSLYPIHPVLFLTLAIAISAYQYQYGLRSVRCLSFLPQFENIIMVGALNVMVCLVAAYVPVFLFRLFLKHTYFTYKGFMFENRRKHSLTTKLWAVVHKLFGLTSPRLRSCDSLLPNLPVPALSDTIERYLETVEPIVSKEEFESVVEKARQFEENEGKKLQLLTRLYSLVTTNYVTSFWEKYAYHYSREPVLINSSVAHLDLFDDIPSSQAERAAHVVYIETLSMLAMDKQTLTRIGEGLLCACHYKKMYATTRIPGLQTDHLRSYGVSRHMVVFNKGIFYKVEMFDENNHIYSIPQLTKTFEELLSRDDGASVAEAHVAALTTDRRDKWCVNRERFFLNNPVNKQTLDIIESAIVFIVLDECEDYDYNPEKPELLDKFLRNMLSGDGKNRWADKSLNYCISKGARCGGTTEHSIADGIEFDHILENFVYMDTRIIQKYYKSIQEKESSHVIPNGHISPDQKTLNLAKRLTFEINDEMKAEIQRCYDAHQDNIDNVDIAATIFRTFGKGRIKEGKISPDAFVQMALQLANYKDQQKFVLTYESASSRYYANARTETLRSATKESCDFVRAMLDPQCDKAERYRLLQTACERHVDRNRDCMVGRGVDRHLFVLYVLSKATSMSSPFLDYYISQPWLLSTSQAPKLTQQMDEDTRIGDSWLGACFGPVAKEGYGVCYRFAGNHSICIHISSFKAAANTDSHRLRKHLIDSFAEMESLFPEHEDTHAN